MLFDLHAHSSGISVCCKVNAGDALRIARENGMDGLVLCNHYQNTSKYMPDGDHRAFSERYLAEYRQAVALAKQMHMGLIFGVEVTMTRYELVHLVIYGVGPDFVRAHTQMYDYTQEQLYRAVKEAGGVLIQAHPYRIKRRLMDVELLDGIEVNCHPKYEDVYLEEMAEIATRYGKILTCGGDYHHDTPYRPKCGMYLPDDVRDTYDLARFLQTASSVDLCVQQVDGSAPQRVTFTRGCGIAARREVQS